MTQLAVNFSLVRYSEVEQTYYFFDPAYPRHIQFALNGQWEAWDVSWIARHTRDQDVRQFAEAQVERLLRDPAHQDYRPWPPQEPPSLSPSAHGEYAPSLTAPLSPTSTLSPTSPRTPGGHATHARKRQRTSYATPYSPPAAHEYDWSQPYPSVEPSAPPPSMGHPRPGRHAPLQAPPPTSGSDNAYVYPSVEPSVPVPPAAHPPPPAPTPPNGHVNSPPARKGSPQQVVAPGQTRQTKLILSLDGDGIRGLSSVLLVESLVNAICKQLNRRVDPYQIFDLIGGVSTTGFLAILIGRLRMRVHQARNAYLAIAKPMFEDKLTFFASLDPHRQLDPYPGPTLEATIKDLVMRECGTLDETFLDTREDSTNVMIISTAVEIGTNQPAIIRSYPSRRTVGPEVPRDLLTWQAMHATLAAPRYVDPSAGPRETTKRAVIQPGFVDYGTAKNSPVRDLCYECRKLYSYTNDTMVIVSIGTGTGTPSPDELKEMTKSVQERTLEAQKWGEKFEIDNRELIKQGWIKYYRFNVDTLHGLPLEEGLAPEAIEAATTAYLAREDVGTQFYAAVGAIVEVLTGHSGPRGQDGESGQ